MPKFKFHELKCVQPFFDDVRSRRKDFELRKNDRGFCVGDILVLVEEPQTEAKAEFPVAVSYVLENSTAEMFGLQPGFCILGLRELTVEERSACQLRMWNNNQLRAMNAKAEDEKRRLPTLRTLLNQAGVHMQEFRDRDLSPGAKQIKLTITLFAIWDVLDRLCGERGDDE